MLRPSRVGCRLNFGLVREIRDGVTAGTAQANFTRKFNVSASTISAICRCDAWGLPALPTEPVKHLSNQQTDAIRASQATGMPASALASLYRSTEMNGNDQTERVAYENKLREYHGISGAEARDLFSRMVDQHIAAHEYNRKLDPDHEATDLGPIRA